MGVLNELIGAVKFIKFFAWEERWIKRVLDARETELQWFIKGVLFIFLGVGSSYSPDVSVKPVSTLFFSR